MGNYYPNEKYFYVHFVQKKQEQRNEPLLSQHVYDLPGIAFFPWGKVGQLKHAVGMQGAFCMGLPLFSVLSVTWAILYTYVNIAFVKTALELALLK